MGSRRMKWKEFDYDIRRTRAGPAIPMSSARRVNPDLKSFVQMQSSYATNRPETVLAGIISSSSPLSSLSATARSTSAVPPPPATYRLRPFGRTLIASLSDCLQRNASRRNLSQRSCMFF